MANEKRLMKAWLVREKDEFCATVVFAETRGKARALAGLRLRKNRLPDP